MLAWSNSSSSHPSKATKDIAAATSGPAPNAESPELIDPRVNAPP
jgi:hypothetical protein